MTRHATSILTLTDAFGIQLASRVRTVCSTTRDSQSTFQDPH